MVMQREMTGTGLRSHTLALMAASYNPCVCGAGGRGLGGWGHWAPCARWAAHGRWPRPPATQRVASGLGRAPVLPARWCRRMPPPRWHTSSTPRTGVAPEPPGSIITVRTRTESAMSATSTSASGGKAARRDADACAASRGTRPSAASLLLGAPPLLQRNADAGASAGLRGCATASEPRRGASGGLCATAAPWALSGLWSIMSLSTLTLGSA